MFRATIGKGKATYVAADPEHPVEIMNSAGSALFRKNAPDVDSGDTELAVGSSVTVTEGQFLISVNHSEIVVREVKIGIYQDVRAAGDITAGDDITVGDKLIVEGESELNGDLNHDGAKIGFFGTAPIAKKNVKPAAEVTAKEIGEALEAYGLLE